MFNLKTFKSYIELFVNFMPQAIVIIKFEKFSDLLGESQNGLIESLLPAHSLLL
jgi:hypothetical protein